jgi:citrate lyase synthetase
MSFSIENWIHELFVYKKSDNWKIFQNVTNNKCFRVGTFVPNLMENKKLRQFNTIPRDAEGYWNEREQV